MIKKIIDFLNLHENEILNRFYKIGSFYISDLLLILDDALDNEIFDRLSVPDRKYVASPRAYRRATQKIIDSIKELAPID